MSKMLSDNQHSIVETTVNGVASTSNLDHIVISSQSTISLNENRAHDSNPDNAEHEADSEDDDLALPNLHTMHMHTVESCIQIPFYEVRTILLKHSSNIPKENLFKCAKINN